MNRERAESKILGPIKSIEFSNLVQTPENPNPILRNNDWMVLGPFVLETDGAFETEYLYEREKILDEDYLVSSGGETKILPYLGMECKNDYYGEDVLVWKEGINKWDTLRFEEEGSDTVDAIYKTEQRNCVYYAAFYVECQENQDAIICYESSGSRLFLNGKLVHDKTYGRVKGLPTMGNQVAVTFDKGMNLVMFKVRTGYICDTVDLSISNCTIYPCLARSGNMGIVAPTKTGVFVGTVKEPRQVFPTFIGAFGGYVKGGSILLKADDYEEHHEISPLDQGEVELIRLTVPLDKDLKNATIDLEVQEYGYEPKQAQYNLELMDFNGFVGEEHIYSDFHFDTTYHQEQRVYALGAIHILKNVVEYLQRDPRFKAIISEVDYLHPYYSIYPDHRRILKNAFVEGRAEADCFYNQPNEMTSSPEGLVRNLVYGQLYHRDIMGRICHIYSPGDVFGHPNQISQICAKGLCYGVAWNKYILGLDPVFRYVSPDGTSLIHNRGSLSRQAAKEYGIRVCHNDGDIVRTVPAYPRDRSTEWMEQTIPKAEFSIPSAFHSGLKREEERVIRDTGNSPFPLTSRDISLYHAGVALTRTDLKQANRLGENLLITAEKLAFIASLYGAKYPEKALDKAWRQILCGQHHDSITGTNNEISFIDLMIQYREAVELGAEMVDRAARFIASGVDTKDHGKPFVVFNPHTWVRREPCVIELRLEKPLENYRMIDSDGNVLEMQPIYQQKQGETYRVKGIFTPEVPAMGYITCYLVEEESQAVKKSNEVTIENDFYRIVVDESQGGGIVSLYDKEEKRELIKSEVYGPANQVLALKEIYDRMETQHEFYTTGHKLSSRDSGAKVESEKGSVFEKLIISTKMGTLAEVRQEIILYHDVKRIDFNTEIIDYQDIDDLFTIIFPVDIKGAKPIFDDRFAPQVRSESQKVLDFQTHQYLMFSHCQVYAANQWMTYGPTVKAIMKENNKEIGSINLGMTALIRSLDPNIMAIGDELLLALTKKALPVTPYADRQQSPLGSRIIHFNEDLLNTDTRIVLSIDGVDNKYEDKLMEMAGKENVVRFKNQVQESGYSFMYLIDDDNQWNKPIDVLLIKGATLASLKSAVENIKTTLLKADSFDITNCILACNPGFVDDYGVSIINTGNIASSVERGGILNLMLFHTAKFYGNNGKVTGGDELVPEQKTHRFTYSLYPHTGSYRDAGVYRKGLEVNDPLFAIDGNERHHRAHLPEKQGFIESNENIVITAIKAGGYPMASMNLDTKDITERGMVIRYFEPHGREGTGEIKFGFGVEKATRVNLLEEGNGDVEIRGNGIKLPITPHTIETLKFDIKPMDSNLGKVILGPEREPIEPTYIRSWEHDLGSMPMGYLAVVGSISRKPSEVDDITLGLNISMANNRPNFWAKGEMKLILPVGWEADRKIIPYSVAPEDHEEFRVIVTKPTKEAKGIIRLNYEDDGQIFEDVFEVGYFNPEIELRLDQERLVAIVSNNTGEKLIGELSIATPIETWGIKGYNPFSLCSIEPRTTKVELAPGEKIEYDFHISNGFGDSFIAFWAAAKLMINGRIFFAYTRRKGERRNIWAHEFINKINAAGGSLLPYLSLD